MSLLFLAFALAHLGLLAWLVRRGRPAVVIGAGAALVAGALVYDNAVVGLGASIGEGELLEAMNGLRFTLHVLLTPLMVIVAARLAVAAGLPWASRFHGADRFRPAYGLASGLVVLGALADGLWPTLVAQEVSGVLRYVPPDAEPPVASILTVLVLIAVGIALWRAGVTPWLAVGSIVMFLGSAVPPGTLPVLGNLAEVALVAGAVASVLAVAGPAAAPPPRTSPQPIPGAS